MLGGSEAVTCVSGGSENIRSLNTMLSRSPLRRSTVSGGMPDWTRRSMTCPGPRKVMWMDGGSAVISSRAESSDGGREESPTETVRCCSSRCP
jgi:hypothetical protein